MTRNNVAIGGKRILVTGGTTGIGRATVKLLAEEGARILTFGRHEEELRESLENAGLAPACGLTADAATREGVDAVFAALDERLSGIDILVACAALGADPLHEMEEEAWRYVIETNLVGYLACARRAIERMEAQGGGQLLFVGSISAQIKAPGESVYSATKAGILSFAETLRKEVAEKNIRVTVIEPGAVGTPMQEMDEAEQAREIVAHKMLLAEDIAEAIHFALTRPARADVVMLRIEPRIQKTA